MSAPVLAFRNPTPPLAKRKKRSDVSQEDANIILRSYELVPRSERALAARVLMLGLPWPDKRTPEEEQLAADLLDIADEYDPMKGGA